jgi:hypothetical protein
MTRSVELRWFQRGCVPERLQHWFTNTLEPGDGLSSRESRTDDYVVIPGCAHVGLKFRSGVALEIKWRQSVIGETWITPTVSGQAERWVKVGAASPSKRLDGSTDDRLMRSVVKHRTSRKYQHSIAGVQAAKPPLAVLSGATVEVTSIEMGGDERWTFGFEAFSTPAASDNELGATFDAIVRHVLSGYDGPTLLKEQSYGYPRWLNMVSDSSLS